MLHLVHIAVVPMWALTTFEYHLSLVKVSILFVSQHTIDVLVRLWLFLI